MSESIVAVPEQKEQKHVAKVEYGRGVLFSNMAELWALAKAFFEGGLAPKGASIASVAGAIIVGQRCGIDPVTSMSVIQIINGRASMMGDIALALVRRSGKLGGYSEQMRGEDGQDDFGCWITAKRADTGEVMERAFTVLDAKRAGLWGQGNWSKWGALRMLRYRALGFLLRDLFSDVLLGLYLSEEMETQDHSFDRLNAEPTAAKPAPTVPDPAFSAELTDAEVQRRDGAGVSEAPVGPQEAQAIVVEPEPELGQDVASEPTTALLPLSTEEAVDLNATQPFALTPEPTPKPPVVPKQRRF